MSEVRHSPGPWRVHGDETAQSFYIHGANRVCDITKPSGFFRLPSETEANAQLIAAAPDLLAALQNIINANDSPPGATTGEARVCEHYANIARAAISKAEGLA